MIMDQQYEFHICVRLCMQIYGLWRPYAGLYICVKSGALLGRAGVNFWSGLRGTRGRSSSSTAQNRGAQ